MSSSSELSKSYEQLQKTDGEPTPARKLLEFSHQGKKFEVFVSLEPDEISMNTETTTASFSVTHNGEMHGQMLADLIATPAGFEAVNLMSSNTQIEARGKNVQKLPTHSPGLIRESIKQLLASHGIIKWTSAASLSDGAVNMYQAMQLDHDLLVTQELAQSNTRTPRFVVTLARH